MHNPPTININERIWRLKGWVSHGDFGQWLKPDQIGSLHESKMPDYENDANLSVELLVEMGDKRIDIEWLPGEGACEWTVTTWCHDIQVSKATTFQTAVAAAWIEWKEGSC